MKMLPLIHNVDTIDNSKNHDKCMNALSDAGIYLILDVNTPKVSVDDLVTQLVE